MSAAATRSIASVRPSAAFTPTFSIGPVHRAGGTLLADAGAVRSVGSRGHSYDNSLAESIIGLCKTEVICKQRSWRSFKQFELAKARWVECYNNRRLHSSIGDVPPELHR